MKVLITGVAGFLGSRFAQWVQQYQAGCEIIGFDDLSCGYQENVPEGCRFVQLDISNRGALEDALLSIGGDIDYVFHFAAYAAEGLSPFIRRYNYTNNLLATAEVVNFCINRDVKRLVFTSSMAVYGRGVWPFHEDDDCRPIDPYGIAKYACEQDIRCAHEQHGLEYCIIRPHNLYGPGQSIWQKYRNVIGNWMMRSFNNEPILVYGDGEQRRAFSWIEDCLPCIWSAAASPAARNQTINLGGRQPVTINEAAQIVSKLTGQQIVHCEPRNEVKDAFCTTKHSEVLLGYKERTSLENGIAAMYQWARAAWQQFPERRESHKVTDIEVAKGLYSYWDDLLPTRDVRATIPEQSSLTGGHASAR